MRQNTKLRTEEQKQEFRGDSTSREGPEKQITIKEGVLSVPRVMTYTPGSQKTGKFLCESVCPKLCLAVKVISQMGNSLDAH